MRKSLLLTLVATSSLLVGCPSKELPVPIKPTMVTSDGKLEMPSAVVEQFGKANRPLKDGAKIIAFTSPEDKLKSAVIQEVTYRDAVARFDLGVNLDKIIADRSITDLMDSFVPGADISNRNAKVEAVFFVAQENGAYLGTVDIAGVIDSNFSHNIIYVTEETSVKGTASDQQAMAAFTTDMTLRKGFNHLIRRYVWSGTWLTITITANSLDLNDVWWRIKADSDLP